MKIPYSALFLTLIVASAHAATPTDALEQSPFLAVVEVVKLTGDTTEFRTVETIESATPVRFVAVMEGARRHGLKPGQILVATLGRRVNGVWAYRSLTPKPMTIRRGTSRAFARFAAEWRARRDASPQLRFDSWIGLTTHPSHLARQIAFDTLYRHAEALRPITSQARLRSLAAPLFEPSTPETETARRVEALGRLGHKKAAKSLAARFDALASRAARRQVAALLARHPVRAGIAVLQRCTKTETPALAARCTRLLTRLIAARKTSPSQPAP